MTPWASPAFLVSPPRKVIPDTKAELSSSVCRATSKWVFPYLVLGHTSFSFRDVNGLLIVSQPSTLRLSHGTPQMAFLLSRFLRPSLGPETEASNLTNNTGFISSKSLVFPPLGFLASFVDLLKALVFVTSILHGVDRLPHTHRRP